MEWSQFNAEEIDLEFNKNPKRIKFENVDENELHQDLIINITGKLEKLREDLQKTISTMNLLHNDLSNLI